MLWIATAYHAEVERIVTGSGLGDKFFHTNVGLLIWVGAALILRCPLRSPVPLAVVILAEVVNEVLDWIAVGAWRWSDTFMDAAATWFWPATLTLLLHQLGKLRQ